MEAVLLQAIITALVTGTVSGLVTYGVMKTELKYLRRDVDHAHARITKLAEVVAKHHV